MLRSLFKYISVSIFFTLFLAASEFTTAVSGDVVQISITKPSNANRYFLLIKGVDDSNRITITKNLSFNTAARVYSVPNLYNGQYYARIAAYQEYDNGSSEWQWSDIYGFKVTQGNVGYQEPEPNDFVLEYNAGGEYMVVRSTIQAAPRYATFLVNADTGVASRKLEQDSTQLFLGVKPGNYYIYNYYFSTRINDWVSAKKQISLRTQEFPAGNLGVNQSSNSFKVSLFGMENVQKATLIFTDSEGKTKYVESMAISSSSRNLTVDISKWGYGQYKATTYFYNGSVKTHVSRDVVFENPNQYLGSTEFVFGGSKGSMVLSFPKVNKDATKVFARVTSRSGYYGSLFSYRPVDGISRTLSSMTNGLYKVEAFEWKIVGGVEKYSKIHESTIELKDSPVEYIPMPPSDFSYLLERGVDGKYALKVTNHVADQAGYYLAIKNLETNVLVYESRSGDRVMEYAGLPEGRYRIYSYYYGLTQWGTNAWVMAAKDLDLSAGSGISEASVSVAKSSAAWSSLVEYRASAYSGVLVENSLYDGPTLVKKESISKTPQDNSFSSVEFVSSFVDLPAYSTGYKIVTRVVESTNAGDKVLLDASTPVSLTRVDYEREKTLYPMTVSGEGSTSIKGVFDIPDDDVVVSKIALYYSHSLTQDGPKTYHTVEEPIAGTGLKSIALVGLNEGFYSVQPYYTTSNGVEKRGSFKDVVLSPVVLPSPAETSMIQNVLSVGIETAWQQGYTGRGVKIGVLDSGFNLFHEDLKDRINVSESYDFAYDRTLQEVIDGGQAEMEKFNGSHGSHVAGTIGAENNGVGIVGVAYNSTLNVYKVSSDTSPSAPSDHISAAIVMATDHGAKVLNLSYGAGGGNQSTMDYFGYYQNYMTSKDTTLVVAAGNDGADCKSLDTCNFLAGGLVSQYSGNIASNDGTIIVVGAYDTATQDIASFSNRAGMYKNNYIMAPGTNIYSVEGSFGTGNNTTGYVYKSGTSMAAPVVTGSFALMAEKYPNLTGSEIAQIFFDTATDLGAPGVDDIYGHGLINVDKAFQPIGAQTLAISETVGDSRISDTVFKASPVVANTLRNKDIKTSFTDSYNRLYIQNNAALMNSVRGSTLLETVHMTTLDEASPLVFGFDQAKQGVSFGIRLKNRMKVLLSQDRGLFGSTGNDYLGFSGNSMYVSIAKDEGPFVYGVSYGASRAVGTGSVVGAVEAKTLGGSVGYRITDDLSVNAKVPMFISSGSLKNVYASQMDENETMSLNNSSVDLKTENVEKELNLSYSKSFDHDISLSLTSRFIQNVMNTEDDEFNANIGLSILF